MKTKLLSFKLLLLVALSVFSSKAWGQSATVSLRPSYIDLSGTTSESAVLMTLSGYFSNDAKYRVFNGSNQYNCWDGSAYVSNNSYGNGPSVVGTPTSTTTFWVLFQRGTNNSVDGTYRDRLGTAYTSNYQSATLPTATPFTTSAYTLSGTVVGCTAYPLTNKYVVLAYNATSGGTLITAGSTAVSSGAISLRVPNGQTIQRVEIRTISNVLLQTITGNWSANTNIGSSINICPPSTYAVTYNGNTNTGGSVPVDANSPYNPGSTVTVLDNTGNLTKTGYTFNNWNTAANGSGNPYSAGNTFTINEATTLYAQWQSTSPILVVTGTTAHAATCLGVAATKQTYTITNSGGVAATGVNVVSNNPEFVVSNLSSTNIAANGGTATYDVTFTPTTAGARTATINITSTEAATASSSLSGTGTAPVTAVATTNAATAITTNTATLSGNSIFGVCPPTTGKGFVISKTSDNATPTVGGTGVTNRTVTLGSAGNYTYPESGLIPATNYSYRAYVYDGTTYTYGVVQKFSTLTPPANDLCADAINLVVNDPVVSGTMVNATLSAPHTTDKDVWYKFTPSCDGRFTINLVGSAGNMLMQLYNACGTTSYLDTTTGTGATKTITTKNTLVGGTTYYVRVAASNPAAESATFTIAVNNQLAINTQPTDQTVGVGATATFTTSAPANATAGTSYQWQFSTDNGTNWTNVVGGTTNATGNQYTTPTTTIGMSGYLYRLVITNGTCSTVTSNAAKLTVVKQSSASDDFRSKQTGAWNVAGSWESFSNGEWIDATLVPSNTAGTITIRNGHTINVSSSINADQVVVEQSGVLDTTTGGSLTIYAGAGDDLIVNGTLRQSGPSTTLTVNSGATVVFNANSHYESYKTSIYPPSATWHATSTCEIKGSPTSINSGQFNQTFGNLIFDMTPTSIMGFSATTTSFKVVGNLDVKNTGGYALCLNNNVANAKSYEVNNLIVRGTSELQLSNRNGTSTTGLTNLKITGNLTLEDNSILAFGKGTSDGPDYFSGTPARSIINLGGHLNASAGSSLIIGGDNLSYGVIEFANTAEKNLSILNPNSNSILFEVLTGSKVKLTNNLTLGGYNGFDIEGEFDLGTHEIVGANDGFNYFYNYPDSTLKIAHPQGIGLLENNTYSTTGAVRVDANGAYPYDIDGNYIYYGTANQITGTGLPEIVKNLTINNTGAANNNEVTLTGDLGLSKDLKVTSGIFNINDKEVVGDMNSTGSDITVASNATLKIGGTRPFPIDFTTIHLDNGSLVDYAGDAQTVANASIADYTNMPAYSNLQISGTGVKTATGTTLVNNIVTVASGELKLPETADNVAPNVLEAKQGIHNTGGMVTFENNAVLMQDTNANNIGAIIVKRHAHVPANQYNLWSSPVVAQDLYALYGSPDSVPNGKVMEYITKTDTFKPMAPGSKSASAKGYSALGLASNDVTAIFNGVPHNGPVSYNAGANTGQGDGYNLIGNPYPSNFDLDTFYTANASQLDGEIDDDNAGDNTAYFWDNTSNDDFGQWGSSYEGDNYAYYNFSSKSGVAAPRIGATKVPNNIIKPGQGFIVKLKNTTASLSFDNTMRTAANTGSVYFKTEAPKRYWLELTTPKQLIISTAVVYNEAAVNTYDKYDTAANTFASDGFYTMTSNAKAVSIQGRQDVNIKDDVVPVGIKAYEAGDYSIRFAKGDNIFADGQDVYLKDNSLNKIVKLTDAGYHFALDKGVNTTRFEIVYQSKTLAVDAVNSQKDIVVYKDADSFVVKARSNAITKVEVYDMLGRLVLVSDKASKEMRIANASLVEGTYVLKISQNNNIVTQKVIK